MDTLQVASGNVKGIPSYNEWKNAILNKFQQVTPNSNGGFQALCPAHDDRKTSLTITIKDDKALLYCHANCTFQAILASVGLTRQDMFFKTSGTPSKQPKRKDITTTYNYVDESGKLLFQTVRYEPKDFKQRHKDSSGKWVWNMQGVRRVLYNLPNVIKAQTVLLVAGEKDCQTAQKLGYVATTNPMGEGKWSASYNEFLAGKDVIIIGDNDEVGQKDVERKTQSLKSAVNSLKSIPALPGVPNKGDLTDWVNLNPDTNTTEALQQIIDSTPYTKEPIPTLPKWAFWTYEIGYKGTIRPVISASQYLDVLEKSGYRVFMKRGTPTIVMDTPNGMVKTTMRGRINTDVKIYILDLLKFEGFDNVADMMLLNGKYFMLDVLEMLPEISREKARNSLFSEVETEVCLNTPIEDETHLITFQGDDWESVLLSTDNFMGISAFSGGGKSNFCELLASLALAPDCEKHSHMHVNIPDGLIIWYDTERSMSDCVRTLKRIARRTHAYNGNGQLLNKAENGFNRLEIKALKGIEDQITFILEHLDSLKDKVSLVIFDGALDLVDSMNAEAEAKAFTDNLMRITKKLSCGVVVTIHGKTNKDDKGSGLGHIGKAIERKCSAFLTIQNQKNEEGRDIKCITTDFAAGKVRNGRVVGVDDYFEWDTKDGMSHFIDYTPPDKPKTSKLYDKVKIRMKRVFQDTKFMYYKELCEKYLGVSEEEMSERTARNHVERARDEWKVLIQGENGMYSLNDDTR